MLRLDETPTHFTLDESVLEGYGGFPESLFLIAVGPEKFAANNITLPDGDKINGLATFPSPDDATSYMGMLAGLSGEIVGRSFEEARQIAISKPVLACVLLFAEGRIIDICYVR
ncbi:MAG: hypothetical protein ABL962_04140 [Fimbriimonadaceae bacterium]